MRKARLFFAIVSLCMSISLFAFGVYSATMVTYTISGSVSYEVKDVLVTIETEVFYCTNYSLITNKKFMTLQNYQPTGQKMEYTSYANGLPNVTDGIDEQIAKIDIDFNKATLYKIIVTISTINKSGVKVELGDVNNFDIPQDATFSLYDTNASKYGEQIYSGNTNGQGNAFEYYVYLTDFTTAITSSFNIPLIITLY